MTQLATVIGLGSDDRARFEEHGAPATVSIIHDDIRDAADGLRAALKCPTPERMEVAAKALLRALQSAPETEVAECPGRLVVIRTGVWYGELMEDLRCDTCGLEVSQ